MRNELSLSLLHVFRRLQTCGAKATFTQLRTAHSATLRCSCLLCAVVAHDAAAVFFFLFFFVSYFIIKLFCSLRFLLTTSTPRSF